MAFLRRSKSNKAKEVKTSAPPPQLPRRDTQPDPDPIEDVETTWKQERRKSRFERRKSIFGRSKSASDARTSISVERPRTAGTGGVATTTTSTAAIGWSRELPSHLSVIGETIEIRAGGDTFNFPTPSPRLPPQGKGSSAFQASPLSLTEPQSSPPAIGVAIGSPTQAPPAWGRSYTADEMNERMGGSAEAAQSQRTIPGDRAAEGGALPRVPELRKKESRWKTLGLLFGRKAARPPAVSEPFYKVQIAQAEPQEQYQTPHSPPYARTLAETPSPSPGMMRSPGSISTHHSRSPSINRGLARFEARMEADRHSFMPSIDGAVGRTTLHANRGSIGSLSPAPTPGQLEGIRTSADLFKTAHQQGGGEEGRRDSPMSASNAEGGGGAQRGAVPGMPRLDLDIPGAEMERYSVMFEKLLEPRQSILERRQSKAKRQKSVVGRGKKELPPIPATPESCGPSPIETKKAVMGPPLGRSMPQRSLTSPHLNRVPSLTVGVAAKKSAGNLKAPLKEQQQEQSATALHRPRPIRRSKTAPPGSVPPVAPNFSRPKPSVFATSTEDLRDAPESPLLGEDSLPPTPTNIMGESGERSIPHETLSVANRKTTTKRNDSVDEQSWDMLTSKPADIPNNTSSPRTQQQQGHHAQYPHIKTPADLERQIVQVSVARQVSVSKARKLVQRAQVESRLPLRPRVVEMKGRGERKSTHVVLIEGGED
ncbi:hypothetical protein B0A55_07216 [Friedmanniomyces simplex]|uniref:Uncharacterized protein n=1 Tax=Friedmanniomyces simplex TaxID=329884 RepID=A0A4U0X977_9PEZI|nr:hypothetical protein B0A55_07216 [Friedmanniomyces simplex]